MRSPRARQDLPAAIPVASAAPSGTEGPNPFRQPQVATQEDMPPPPPPPPPPPHAVAVADSGQRMARRVEEEDDDDDDDVQVVGESVVIMQPDLKVEVVRAIR